MLMTRAAQAYMNHGRWIADCPRNGCRNALALQPGQAQFHCTPCGCGVFADVEWPPDFEIIDAVLSVRPIPETRHWAPAGHRQSIACGSPEGQTVMDLINESTNHEELP